MTNYANIKYPFWHSEPPAPKPPFTIETLEQFVTAVKDFNWYYTMSDDHRCWERGTTVRREILRYAETDDRAKWVWETAKRAKFGSGEMT